MTRPLTVGAARPTASTESKPDDRVGPAIRRPLIAGMLALPVLAACNPTVRVEAPTEPIEINLNVRIEQEILIKIERELEQLFEEEDDIF